MQSLITFTQKLYTELKFDFLLA